MDKIVELFGTDTRAQGVDWPSIVEAQQCPFSHKKCFKTRKSEPEISIGTCTVLASRTTGAGRSLEPVMICPNRLTDRQKIFTDCTHLLTKHQPGNDYHLLSEIQIPGGNLDYVLVSAKGQKAVDFVGIELQTLDTTGSVWPSRMSTLNRLGIPSPVPASKSYGMNWKMTAKTILVQMHHKASTFANINRHLVLVIQDPLLDYMRREFNFDHFVDPADLTDTVHFHSYGMQPLVSGQVRAGLELHTRISTDVAGIERCLGLRSESAIEESILLERISAKLSERTLFSPLSSS